MVETPSQVCKTCKQICAITPIKAGSCGNSAKSDTVSGIHSESLSHAMSLLFFADWSYLCRILNHMLKRINVLSDEYMLSA